MMIFRIACAVCFLVASAAMAADDTCVYNGPSSKAPLADQLKRGVNLSGWWEGDRHNKFSDRDFQNISDAGFNFVRLPVDPKWLAIADKQKQADILHELNCNAVSIMNHHLLLILDLHPGSSAEEHNMNSMSPEQLEAYLAGLWKTVAPVLKNIPENRIGFNLLNEPNIQLRPYWWKVQEGLIKKLRETYPRYLFIASSVENGPWYYNGLVPYADTNIIYDFHFYQPMFLTHHGADWMKPFDPTQKSDHIFYPVAGHATPAGAGKDMREYIAKGWNNAALAAEMNAVMTWAVQNKAKLICLEFGVYRPYVSMESRGNWLRDMREILEAHHIPWAVWEYNEGFGITEPKGGISKEIRSSLGLKQETNATAHAK